MHGVLIFEILTRVFVTVFFFQWHNNYTIATRLTQFFNNCFTQIPEGLFTLVASKHFQKLVITKEKNYIY